MLLAFQDNYCNIRWKLRKIQSVSFYSTILTGNLLAAHAQLLIDNYDCGVTSMHGISLDGAGRPESSSHRIAGHYSGLSQVKR